MSMSDAALKFAFNLSKIQPTGILDKRDQNPIKLNGISISY